MRGRAWKLLIGFVDAGELIGETRKEVISGTDPHAKSGFGVKEPICTATYISIQSSEDIWGFSSS